jgi:hypothetical protein
MNSLIRYFNFLPSAMNALDESMKLTELNIRKCKVFVHKIVVHYTCSVFGETSL